MRKIYDELEAATTIPMSVSYKFDFGEFQYSMMYADGTYRLIVIIPGSMIFVVDADRNSLDYFIDNDMLDRYDSYDLVDGCAYYLNSPYALDIAEAMIAMTSTCSRQCPLMSTAAVEN